MITSCYVHCNSRHACVPSSATDYSYVIKISRQNIFLNERLRYITRTADYIFQYNVPFLSQRFYFLHEKLRVFIYIDYS